MKGTQFGYGSNQWEVVQVLEEVCTIAGHAGAFNKVRCKAIASLGRGFDMYAQLPLYPVGQEVIFSTWRVNRGKTARPC